MQFLLILINKMDFILDMTEMDKEHFLKLLGERIKEIRSNNNLSQDAIADYTHLERSYLSGIELGKRNPSAYTLLLLANALKVDICDLFSFLK